MKYIMRHKPVDTLIVKLNVTYEGEVSIQNRDFLFAYYENFTFELESVLDKISPIEPAMFQDKPIGCLIKLPIIFDK